MDNPELGTKTSTMDNYVVWVHGLNSDVWRLKLQKRLLIGGLSSLLPSCRARCQGGNCVCAAGSHFYLLQACELCGVWGSGNPGEPGESRASFLCVRVCNTLYTISCSG
jgi:hypothetical protein